MTRQEVAKMVMDLAVGGFVNREKFTYKRIDDTFKALLREPRSQYIFEIALPDGWWYCQATRDVWGYDLYVPDTREQEQYLIDKLYGVTNKG